MDPFLPHAESSISPESSIRGNLQNKALAESEKKLAIANNELARVLNTISDLVFSADLVANKVIYVSRACEKIYGYTPEEFSSDINLWNKLIHANDRHVLRNHFRKLNDGITVDNQYRVIHKDGSVRWVENHIVPTLDENRNLIRIDGITRDITEKQKAEAEIRSLNESLEQKVRERTRELEEVNKELESFTYSVSHDLRAPLRIINGFGKLLHTRYSAKLEEGGNEYVKIILDTTAQMGQLIDDLLDFSRLGRTPLTKSCTNMQKLVKGIVDSYRLTERDAAPEIQIKELIPAECDYNLIRQVWSNLVSNAVKYSKKKENPRIEIGTLGVNGQVTYYVKDNGAGFDMNHYDKLFGVFQRLHKVTEYEGTGVGLALAQRIVERHGGKIWAESTLNEGATFYFTLPAIRSMAA